MNMKRRDFLKAGSGLTAAALSMIPGLGPTCPPLLQRRLCAGPPVCDKKLLFIFLRGGMDGISTVIPRGDSSYNATNRPSLFIPEASAYDLGNNFAQLHPAMDRMIEVFNAGDVAIVHRVGYRGQTRSHFDSQQYWENGTLDRELEVGIFNRHMQNSSSVCREGFTAAAISGALPVALRGPFAVPNFRDPRDYSFRGTESQIAKFVGQAPSAGDPRGLLGILGGQQDFSGKSYRDQLYGAGLVLTETMEVLGGIDPGSYQPQNGATYPTGEFGLSVRYAAQLFKETPVQVLGIDLVGFDNHTTQAGLFGSLMRSIAHAFQGLSRDLGDQWNDLVVVTMTEFGRTSSENGSLGTDHGEATAMFVGGGSVNGGVYNCDSSTWQNGDVFSVGGRYLEHRTDFRSVMGEIFRGHFGDSDSVVNTAIPNYSSLANADPLGFTPLGIF
jgi:uncharacterized protein (DUF1501 family)